MTTKSLQGMMGLLLEFDMEVLLIRALKHSRYIVVTKREENVSRPYELQIWDCKSNRFTALREIRVVRINVPP